jgi:methylated-DNA-[protein]-cysteine S-methyltransferase
MHAVIASPLGPIRLTAGPRGLTGVEFVEEEPGGDRTGLLTEAAGQLAAYFAGTLTDFTIPLDPRGTAFQREVWRVLATVPFGQTITYARIARMIGKPGGSQAVGKANGSNRIAILLPCHRVIASDGKLTGYAGGIERKKWLLRHESATLF